MQWSWKSSLGKTASVLVPDESDLLEAARCDVEDGDVQSPEERRSAQDEVISAAELSQGRLQSLQIVAKSSAVGEDGMEIAAANNFGVRFNVWVDAAHLPEYFTGLE